MKYKIMPWYFKVLGFYYRFNLVVIGDPKPTDNGTYLYEVMFLGNELWWLGIKLKTYDD